MINFNLKCWEDTYSPDKAAEALKEHSNRILSDLANAKQDKFFLGVHLLEFYKSNSYAQNIYRKRKWCFVADKGYFDWVVIDGYSGNARACHFFDYCFDQFGLDKTQVSRLMNIVDEFGDEFRGFAKEWQAYSYSQLVEMLPLTVDQRKSIQSDWTIKRIREYKKDLVATSQQNEPSGSKLSVATSQQQKDPVNFYSAIVIPPSDMYPHLAKYDRFRNVRLVDLIDDYIRIEAELENLKNISFSNDDENFDDEDACDCIPVFRRSKLGRAVAHLVGGEA